MARRKGAADARMAKSCEFATLIATNGSMCGARGAFVDGLVRLV
ncbi:MAG: hypothetical protein ABRQ26_12765 [Syntrophomonadaceae bacterium]